LFEHVHRAVGPQHRADRDRALERDARGRRSRRDAQREVAAEREAGDRHARLRQRALNRAHCADDFIEPARVKDFLVQMMARAVIAKVQAVHVAAELEQITAERQHVQRIGAAFPTMQQDREIARGRAACRDLTRIVAEQPHAVAAVDDLRFGARQQPARAPRDQWTPQAQARHDRLQVRVDEPAGRRERGRRSEGHESMRMVRNLAA
jgi:hypothetical protein